MPHKGARNKLCVSRQACPVTDVQTTDSVHIPAVNVDSCLYSRSVNSVETLDTAPCIGRHAATPSARWSRRSDGLLVPSAPCSYQHWCRRTFSRAKEVQTQTASGTYAWLVRLIADDGRDDICGYVWRGEEAGRADGTLMRVQFDKGCRHWSE